MNTGSPVDYLPIFIMFTIAVGFAVVSLFATHKLGPLRKTKVKLRILRMWNRNTGQCAGTFFH